MDKTSPEITNTSSTKAAQADAERAAPEVAQAKADETRSLCDLAKAFFSSGRDGPAWRMAALVICCLPRLVSAAVAVEVVLAGHRYLA